MRCPLIVLHNPASLASLTPKRLTGALTTAADFLCRLRVAEPVVVGALTPRPDVPRNFAKSHHLQSPQNLVYVDWTYGGHNVLQQQVIHVGYEIKVNQVVIKRDAVASAVHGSYG